MADPTTAQAAPVLIWPIIISVFVALIAARIIALILFYLVIGRKGTSSTKVLKEMDRVMKQLGKWMGMDARGVDIAPSDKDLRK